MIVKIGDMLFNSEIEAIMIFFTSEEKKLISEMDESATIFGSFPVDYNIKNANTMMSTFKADTSKIETPVKKNIVSKIEQMTNALFGLYGSLSDTCIQQHYLLGLYDGIITQQEYEIAESIYGHMWTFGPGKTLC